MTNYGGQRLKSYIVLYSLWSIVNMIQNIFSFLSTFDLIFFLLDIYVILKISHHNIDIIWLKFMCYWIEYSIMVIWCPTMKEIGVMITFLWWFMWKLYQSPCRALAGGDNVRLVGRYGKMRNGQPSILYQDDEGKVLWCRIQQVSMVVITFMSATSMNLDVWY